jgi:phospholipase C
LDLARGALRIDFANTGDVGAVFQVCSGDPSEGPFSFTVGAGDSQSGIFPVRGRFELSVFGPNGFLRSFRGNASPEAKADLQVDSRYQTDGLAVVLRVVNRGTSARVVAANAYGNEGPTDRRLRAGESFEKKFSLESNFGWYDISVRTDEDDDFLRRVAGHVENGRESASDPAFGARG